MLVLSRYVGEKLMVTDQEGRLIEIKVKEVRKAGRGAQVVYAINAPDDVSVIREELIGRGPDA